MGKSPSARHWVNYQDRSRLVVDLRAGGFEHTAEFFRLSDEHKLPAMNIPPLPLESRRDTSAALMTLITEATAQGKSQTFIFAGDPSDPEVGDMVGPEGFSGLALLVMAARRIFLVYGKPDLKVYRAAVEEALIAPCSISIVVETTPTLRQEWEEWLGARIVAGSDMMATKLVVCHDTLFLH